MKKNSLSKGPRLLMWEANCSILIPSPPLTFFKGKVGYQGFSDKISFSNKTNKLLAFIYTSIRSHDKNITKYSVLHFFPPCKSFSSVCNMATEGKRQKCKKKKQVVKLWWISELTLKGTLFFLSKVFQSSLQHCLLFSFTPSSSSPMHHFKFL